MRELGTGYAEAVVACWTCFGGGFGNNVRARDSSQHAITIVDFYCIVGNREMSPKNDFVMDQTSVSLIYFNWFGQIWMNNWTLLSSSFAIQH
jgi:hypothetical protein